jgi:hypothetical protein
MAAATTKTPRVAVHGNVKLPDLHAAIARDVNATGGAALSLLGIDLETLCGNPALENQFKEIPGIAKAKFD